MDENQKDAVHDPSGKHLILDFYECGIDLTKTRSLQQLLNAIMKKANIIVVRRSRFRWPGGGVSTWLYTLATSSLVIHTWPESGFLGFDLNTCDINCDFDTVEKMLTNKLKPTRVEKARLTRGAGPIQAETSSAMLVQKKLRQSICV